MENIEGIASSAEGVNEIVVNDLGFYTVMGVSGEKEKILLGKFPSYEIAKIFADACAKLVDESDRRERAYSSLLSMFTINKSISMAYEIYNPNGHLDLRGRE